MPLGCLCTSWVDEHLRMCVLLWFLGVSENCHLLSMCYVNPPGLMPPGRHSWPHSLDGRGGSVLPEDAGTEEQKEALDKICQAPELGSFPVFPQEGPLRPESRTRASERLCPRRSCVWFPAVQGSPPSPPSPVWLPLALLTTCPQGLCPQVNPVGPSLCPVCLPLTGLAEQHSVSLSQSALALARRAQLPGFVLRLEDTGTASNKLALGNLCRQLPRMHLLPEACRESVPNDLFPPQGEWLRGYSLGVCWGRAPLQGCLCSHRALPVTSSPQGQSSP